MLYQNGGFLIKNRMKNLKIIINITQNIIFGQKTILQKYDVNVNSNNLKHFPNKMCRKEKMSNSTDCSSRYTLATEK